jgi:hypothetical protein
MTPLTFGTVDKKPCECYFHKKFRGNFLTTNMGNNSTTSIELEIWTWVQCHKTKPSSGTEGRIIDGRYFSGEIVTKLSQDCPPNCGQSPLGTREKYCDCACRINVKKGKNGKWEGDALGGMNQKDLDSLLSDLEYSLGAWDDTREKALLNDLAKKCHEQCRAALDQPFDPGQCCGSEPGDFIPPWVH